MSMQIAIGALTFVSVLSALTVLRDALEDRDGNFPVSISHKGVMTFLRFGRLGGSIYLAKR